jgi:hypothetical protein
LATTVHSAGADGQPEDRLQVGWSKQANIRCASSRKLCA